MSFIVADLPERWAHVPGYDGRYEVSTTGRVRGVDRLVCRGRIQVLHRGVHLRAAIRPRDGYRSVHLWSDGKKATKVVHRLVALAFLGEPESPTYEVCHVDGDSLNNCVSNLRWDTHSANMYDRVKHGRHHNVMKTHCPQGHAYTEANIRRQHGGRGRACRECINARRRKK